MTACVMIAATPDVGALKAVLNLLDGERVSDRSAVLVHNTCPGLLSPAHLMHSAQPHVFLACAELS